MFYTVKNWIYDYYNIYQSIRLKPGTLSAYNTTLCRIPEEWDFRNISRMTIQLWINKLSAELSSSTVRHIFHCLRSALIAAPDYGLTDRRDCVNNIILPPIRKKAIHALSDEDLSKLLRYIFKSDYKDIFLMLIHTGLRFGELAGLNCSDIDFKNNTITIQRNFYRGKIQTTKTASGVRIIPLNSVTAGICRDNYILGQPDAPLFRSVRCGRLIYNTILKNWRKICAEAQIEPTGLHSLRHTFATQMLCNDVPLKVVSELLGHKSINITADIYTDVPLKLKKSAVDTLKFGAI